MACMNLQERAKLFADNCCTVSCYVFIGSCAWEDFACKQQKDREELMLYDLFQIRIHNMGVLEDGYVQDPYEVLGYVSGSTKWQVTKRDVTSMADTGGELCIGQYVYKDKGHFVVIYKNEVIYDPIGKSEIVKKGNLFDVRFVKFDGTLFVPVIKEACTIVETVHN